jgi:hypothetical protein
MVVGSSKDSGILDFAHSPTKTLALLARVETRCGMASSYGGDPFRELFDVLAESLGIVRVCEWLAKWLRRVRK